MTREERVVVYGALRTHVEYLRVTLNGMIERKGEAFAKSQGIWLYDDIKICEYLLKRLNSDEPVSL